jgi:hypothetical protein
VYARFHNIHKIHPTRHRYSFIRDSTAAWVLSPPGEPMRSAVFPFCEHVCVDGCWICLVIEEEENADTVISFLDDVREEDWNDRIAGLTFWSAQDRSRSYTMLI